MKKIIMFFLCFSIIGCTQYEFLYIPIINHTNFNYNLTIMYEDNIIIKDYYIGESAVTIINKKLEFEDYKYIPIIFQIERKAASFPIIENELYFPGGGLVSNSAKGGLFVAIDIFNENDSIIAIYSQNVFTYGFPPNLLLGDDLLK